MITRSPGLMLRPSLMKSVPSVQDWGICVPISCGFFTAFMETPETPFGALIGFLLLLRAGTSLALPIAVAGAVPGKAERPGTPGPENAFVLGRLLRATSESARMGAANIAPRFRSEDCAMFTTTPRSNPPEHTPGTGLHVSSACYPLRLSAPYD